MGMMMIESSDTHDGMGNKSNNIRGLSLAILYFMEFIDEKNVSTFQHNLN